MSLTRREGKTPEVVWFCAFTPVEVLEAAGLSHRRAIGVPEDAEEADSYLHPSICPYVKACLVEGFRLPEGRRHAVFVNACDAMRRLFDAWSEIFPEAFVHLMDLPRGNSPREVELLSEEMKRLADKLEQGFGVRVTREAVTEAWRRRRERRQTYLLQAPRLSAGERVQTSLALQSSHTVIAPTVKSEAASGGAIPVAVVGNFLNPRGILEELELAGARAVVLDVCNGDRPFLAPSEPEDEEEDIYRQLAVAYLRRPHCARMQDWQGRVDSLFKRIRESGAVGLIYVALKFCDPYIYEFPLLEKALEEEGIKVLRLESDYLDANAGQVATRVEAFLEMLSGGRRG